MTSFKINRKLRILTPGFRADADVLCPALQRAECHAAFLKELAEELSAATFPIVSDNTDFRHAYKTIHIEPKDGFTGLPLEKYSFEVKFKPNSNDDNVTDILYMEVDGSTNKIIKIDSGERKVI